MREHRIGTASFIPLGEVKVKEINERYRSLGSAYHLALDLIQCTDEIKQAVRYAVENTVICDEVGRQQCDVTVIIPTSAN